MFFDPPAKPNTRKQGSEAEDLACEQLLSLGYTIQERNWHFHNRGELDIVAIDPDRFGQTYLIFVEVKSRHENLEASICALPPSKQAQIKKLASAYIYEKKLNPDKLNISFDFIAVSRNKIEHFKDIFV